jgi:hypothetical protein
MMALRWCNDFPPRHSRLIGQSRTRLNFRDSFLLLAGKFNGHLLQLC